MSPSSHREERGPNRNTLSTGNKCGTNAWRNTLHVTWETPFWKSRLHPPTPRLSSPCFPASQTVRHIDASRAATFNGKHIASYTIFRPWQAGSVQVLDVETTPGNGERREHRRHNIDNVVSSEGIQTIFRFKVTLLPKGFLT